MQKYHKRLLIRSLFIIPYCWIVNWGLFLPLLHIYKLNRLKGCWNMFEDRSDTNGLLFATQWSNRMPTFISDSYHLFNNYFDWNLWQNVEGDLHSEWHLRWWCSSTNHLNWHKKEARNNVKRIWLVFFIIVHLCVKMLFSRSFVWQFNRHRSIGYYLMRKIELECWMVNWNSWPLLWIWSFFNQKFMHESRSDCLAKKIEIQLYNGQKRRREKKTPNWIPSTVNCDI